MIQEILDKAADLPNAEQLSMQVSKMQSVVYAELKAMRDAGDDEAQMLDMDFVEMLEYGMPPACGWGNSERNFWLLEGVPGREAVPFPTMRKID